MGVRLRLAQGLIDGNLSTDEKKIAEENPVISAMAKIMKAEKPKEEKPTKRKVVKNG